MNHSEQVIRSMYRHLVQSYSPEEAREILMQKYPDDEGDINVIVAAADIEDEASALEEANSRSIVDHVRARIKKTKPVKTKAPSKMDKARELYNSASDKSRKAIMNLFVSELGLGKAAASTYYYSVKS